jgi:GT2 family glycosyltransferase
LSFGHSELPVVSIVIPLYKSFGTIGKVLETIVGLHYPKNKIEVIFVYYPTEDSTIDIIKSFWENYGKLFYDIKIIWRTDKRANVARNIGIKSSSGEYVFLLNDDVLLDPFTILNAIEVFKKHPDAYVVTFPYVLDPPRIWEKALFFRYYGRVSRTRTLNLGCSILRKEVFDRVGYIREDMGPPLSSNDDFEYSARVNKAGMKIYIDGRIILKDIGSQKNYQYLSDNRQKVSKYIYAIYFLISLLKYDYTKGADTYDIVLRNAPILWKIENFLYVIIPFAFIIALIMNFLIFIILIVLLILFPVIYYRKPSGRLLIYFMLILGRRIIRAHLYIIARTLRM